jgi:hypothetical protein
MKEFEDSMIQKGWLKADQRLSGPMYQAGRVEISGLFMQYCIVLRLM